MLDPELRERPPDLGRAAAVDLAGLGGAEIVAAPVRIEAHRQPVLRENLAQRPEGRGGSLLFDQEGRIDRPRRVVERDNQIKGGLPLSQAWLEPSPAFAGAGSDAASCPAGDGARACADAPPCAAPSEQRPSIADAA
jgi:hypothetical protein